MLAIEGAIKPRRLMLTVYVTPAIPTKGMQRRGVDRIPAEGGVQRLVQLFNIWTALQRYLLALASSWVIIS